MEDYQIKKASGIVVLDQSGKDYLRSNYQNKFLCKVIPTSTNINIEGDFCEYVISSLDGKKIFSGHESYINTTLFKPGAVNEVLYFSFSNLFHLNRMRFSLRLIAPIPGLYAY